MGREVLRKHLDIQTAVDIGGRGLVLEEIGRERGGGNEIRACGMDGDVCKVCRALLYQLQPVSCREQALVFRQNEQVQVLALLGVTGSSSGSSGHSGISRTSSG